LALWGMDVPARSIFPSSSHAQFLYVLLQGFAILFSTVTSTHREFLMTSTFNSIQFIDHLYSPPLSKVHYGRALYSSRKIRNKLTSGISICSKMITDHRLM